MFEWARREKIERERLGLAPQDMAKRRNPRLNRRITLVLFIPTLVSVWRGWPEGDGKFYWALVLIAPFLFLSIVRDTWIIYKKDL